MCKFRDVVEFIKPMVSESKDQDWIFWTTVVISFVLIVHNGTEPLFILALASLPILIFLYLVKPSLIPLVLYLIVFGVLGRYTRYLRQTYASDTILALRDFIGYFLAGNNVYAQHTMAQTGKVPFTYLPFALLWYLPSYLFSIDYRLFEVLISGINLVWLVIYARLTRAITLVPILAVISLTPFLMDLSADGSSDNSAVFLLVTAILLFIFSVRQKSSRAAYASAIVFGLSNSFKHYVWFFTLFFVPYLLWGKLKLPISRRQYLLTFLGVFAVITVPFIVVSPKGFIESLTLIEMRQGYQSWGWNIWVGLRDGLGLTITSGQMWLVRALATVACILGLLKWGQPLTLKRVFISSGLTLFIYLLFSKWTTYAYFTFLVPLLALSIASEG